MTPSANLSLSESVQQLRAEILAPDWQLSPQRIARLQAALRTLATFFHERPHALALLKMAASVLEHINSTGGAVRDIDFLKEVMAHIVGLHDDDEPDRQRDQETASKAYKRFQRLGIELGKTPAAQADPEAGRALVAKLNNLAKEAALLPDMLRAAGELSSDERQQVATQLGKISGALNIVWAHLPPQG